MRPNFFTMRIFFALLIGISLLACQSTPPKESEEKLVEASPDAQKIVDKAIEVAGGELYKTSMIQFYFRNKKFKVRRWGGEYRMIRVTKKDGDVIRDIVMNDSFIRKINKKEVVVPDSMINKYRNSINSVFYFALLPYGLNDGAVRKKYLGTKTIKGELYDKIEVRFDEEGGGDDFQDVYVYWINQKTSLIDYLAYSYEVNGGGLRFREAYDSKKINGIRFANYINYQADYKNVKVQDLDDLFVAGKLKALSKIVLDKITVGPNQPQK